MAKNDILPKDHKEFKSTGIDFRDMCVTVQEQQTLLLKNIRETNHWFATYPSTPFFKEYDYICVLLSEAIRFRNDSLVYSNSDEGWLSNILYYTELLKPSLYLSYIEKYSKDPKYDVQPCIDLTYKYLKFLEPLNDLNNHEVSLGVKKTTHSK